MQLKSVQTGVVQVAIAGVLLMVAFWGGCKYGNIVFVSDTRLARCRVPARHHSQPSARKGGFGIQRKCRRQASGRIPTVAPTKLAVPTIAK